MKHTTVLIIFILFYLPHFAQTELKDSKDHPVVSRLNVSWIRFYEFNKFNQYKLRIFTIKKGGESENHMRRIYAHCLAMPKNG